jgi:hypothetical protein
VSPSIISNICMLFIADHPASLKVRNVRRPPPASVFLAKSLVDFFRSSILALPEVVIDGLKRGSPAAACAKRSHCVTRSVGGFAEISGSRVPGPDGMGRRASKICHSVSGGAARITHPRILAPPGHDSKHL